MPEGHTIHRLARDLRRDLTEEPVHAWSPQGRFTDGAARLDGNRIVGTEAHGKHLFVDWDTGDTLYVHLGLIGKFRPSPSTDEPRGAIRLRLASNGTAWDLSGPMACRLATPDERERVLRNAGPDPLRRDADPARFGAALEKRAAPIGAALLDQSVIGGIGNVYRAELCFLCGVLPTRPARSLSADEVRCLWDEAVRLLRIGLRGNRIVTRDPAEVGVPGPAKVPQDERLYVYKRGGEACYRCGAPIESADVGGRRTWWCPHCQR
jgi:endonuclease-8